MIMMMIIMMKNAEEAMNNKLKQIKIFKIG
jgi:hypothetical protein